MLDLSQVSPQVLLATFKEQAWRLSELARILKVAASSEIAFEGDTRELVLLILGDGLRQRAIRELRLESDAGLVDGWKPLLDPLIGATVPGPIRYTSASDVWRKTIERGLFETLDFWASGGFLIEPLENALRRLLDAKHEEIHGLSLAEAYSEPQPTRTWLEILKLESKPDPDGSPSREFKFSEVLKYKSQVKLAIAFQLMMQDPNLSGLEICDLLDEQGVQLPDSWKDAPNDRSFRAAYLGKHTNKIDTLASKVRKDLRDAKLIQ